MYDNFITSELYFFKTKLSDYYFGNTYLYKIKPRIGKTKFILKLIEEFCLNQKIPSLFFSLEMAKTTFERKKLLDTSNPNLFIIDTPNLNIEDLCSIATDYIYKNKIKLVFINYLSLLTLEEHIDYAEKEKIILQKLKEFSKKNNIIIISSDKLSEEYDETIKYYS